MSYTQGIDLSELKRLLSYDSETGKFAWLVKRNGVKGGEAGFTNVHGYRCIGLNRKQYNCHRLAWLYHYGEWSEQDIDHINCDRSDNRIKNLRLGGRDINPRNQGIRSTNTTGFKGVKAPSGRSKKYIAKICVNYEHVYLGSFATPQEAHEAYKTAAEKYFGEFARAS